MGTYLVFASLILVKYGYFNGPVAFDNARLFEAEERRVEQFRVLSEVGRKIASILDVERLIDEIVS